MAVVASISQQIWDMKYRLKGPSGEPIDKTIEDSWRRVATALAAPERDPAVWGERFYAAMSDFKFLPAGRVVAGAGSGRLVTLFNCFVMGMIPDDMGGIFAHLRAAHRSRVWAPTRRDRSHSWMSGTRCAGRS
jgi:ribonucleoside-diphosphate reductase alpha chain